MAGTESRHAETVSCGAGAAGAKRASPFKNPATEAMQRAGMLWTQQCETLLDDTGAGAGAGAA